MKIEVCEIHEDTITGNDELVVIVQSDEIFDLRHVLAYMDEHYAGLWAEWDRSRPIFHPPAWDVWMAARAEGHRFLDYWHFERIN